MDIQNLIDAVWGLASDDRARKLPMAKQWLNVEQEARTILLLHRNGVYSAEHALRGISALLAAYTLRGDVLE